MPELPEVETVCTGIRPFMDQALFKKVILNRSNLRFPFDKDFKEKIENQKALHVKRRAKYIQIFLSSGRMLLIHLGMSGTFRIENTSSIIKLDEKQTHPKKKDSKHDHVIFQMDNGGHIIYNDPRRFGFMVLIERDDYETHPFLHKLGIEPLSNHFHADFLAHKCAHKNKSIKAALLDQSIVAGLGNIYVCEALFRAKIHPLKKGSALVLKNQKPSKAIENLAYHIPIILREAIEAGGSSLQDHRQADGQMGYFQHHFDVYGRENEPCKTKNCKGTIKRLVQNGRSTFYCPICQKHPKE